MQSQCISCIDEGLVSVVLQLFEVLDAESV